MKPTRLAQLDAYQGQEKHKEGCSYADNVCTHRNAIADHSGRREPSQHEVQKKEKKEHRQGKASPFIPPKNNVQPKACRYSHQSGEVRESLVKKLTGGSGGGGAEVVEHWTYRTETGRPRHVAVADTEGAVGGAAVAFPTVPTSSVIRERRWSANGIVALARDTQPSGATQAAARWAGSRPRKVRAGRR